VLGAVACLEGLWVWLLTAALAQIEGQGAPSLFALIAVIPFAWVLARVLWLAGVSTARRRTILVGGGLGLALAAATIQSGLAVPLALVLAHPDPDYRGSAVALGFLVAYLWARGLALAGTATRRHVVNHVLVSTFVLANILLVFPLAGPVREAGTSVVVGAFFAAVIGLLLVQTAETESRELTKTQWLGLCALAVTVMVVAAGLFTGVLASGLPADFGNLLGRGARVALPVTDAVLIAVGYAAHYLTLFFLYLRNLYGTDPEAAQRVQREAEQSRFRLQDDGTYGPPEIMTIAAVLIVVGLLVWWLVHVLSRLVAAADQQQRSPDVESRSSLRDGTLLDGLREALGHLPGLGGLTDGLSGRGAEIRRHYRRFEALMARADLPRTASQTAVEYQRQLAAVLPSAAAPLETISEVYTLARYSEPAISLPDPAVMEEAVRNVRTALQAADRHQPTPAEEAEET
jgi:hypothetical protein